MRSTFKALFLCATLASAAPAAAVGEAPIWRTEQLAQLRATAESAPAEGLAPETAALAELARLQAAAGRSRRSVQVDNAANALFDSLARAFATGATDPTWVDRTWTIARASAPDLAALHAELANGGAPDAMLRALLPASGEYLALRAELQRVAVEPADQVGAPGLDRETRLGRLRANLERWRWLPRTIEATRVEVRVPAAQALLFKAGGVVSTHGVIVGARRSPTPTMAAMIRAVTLNPNWDPPADIVRRELLPRFARNPAAAAREGYEALDAQGVAVDPATVNWAARPFPYHLRQRSGAGNALGRIRFDLPNPNAIFLHDTPNHALFARADRALSHGCIRVDDPLGLAAGLLNAAEWTPETLQSAIDAGIQQQIEVRPAAPVYILYLTAALGDDGAIAYYDDLYHRDGPMIAALRAPDVALVADRGDTPEVCPA